MARRKRIATDQRPFTIVYNDFLRSIFLDYYEKMVFIIIKSYADNDTLQAFPSAQTISKVSGISLAKTKRCLKSMEKKGIIKVENRYSENGKKQSNLYTLYDYAELWDENKVPDPLKEREKEWSLVKQLEKMGYTVTKKKDSTKASTTTQSQSHQISKAVSNKANNPSTTHDTEKAKESQVIERYPEEWIIDFYNLNELKEENPTKAAVIDTVANILYTILNSTKETIRVNGEDKPTMTVVGRMLKLNQETIMYAIDQFIRQTDKIKNPRAYMITCLYNAQEQYQLALNNQVSHDMAHYED